MRSSTASTFIVVGLALIGCGGKGAVDTDDPHKPPPFDGVIDDASDFPEAQDAVVEADPTAPLGSDGSPLDWPEAPLLEPVQIAANDDSAVIIVPAVVGAADYRAYVITPELSISAAGETTIVANTRIHCAGIRQRNRGAEAPQVMRLLEITGIHTPSHVVIEAIDVQCPFPGPRGATHADITPINPGLSLEEKVDFSIFTTDEIIAHYGADMINGHGAGTTLASPGANSPARVLARTTVLITPSPRTLPMTFFDRFADASDQPTFVANLDDTGGRSQQGRLYQNSNWSFYSYGTEHRDFFIEAGQLHMVLADWAQDIFGHNIAYPKKPVAIDSTDYLHITFEVPSNSTSRRYWWLFLCGAETLGETMNADGTLKSPLVQTSFFYQADGHNPSLGKWNCFQMFPRDGWPFNLPPTGTRPESDLRVMVNVPNAPNRESVRNVSPPQYSSHIGAPGWFRQQNAAGEFVAPIIDDQMLIAPRTRYDVFLRRNRVIVYVNGEQRLCNNFGSVPLTMAEGALGFGQVLYHSAAERHDFNQSFNLRTGQIYYLQNTPYVDARAWDNLGYNENTTAPSSFDETHCYTPELG